MLTIQLLVQVLRQFADVESLQIISRSSSMSNSWLEYSADSFKLQQYVRPSITVFKVRSFDFSDKSKLQISGFSICKNTR